MKILLFSSLFPSSARPVHGTFVESRLRELLKTGQVQARVVAPVPWFPSTAPRFGSYARFAATPRFEHRNGISVHHPRYFLLPKLGMSQAPFSMALGALPTLRRLQREGFDFDLIDAHYFYPDGVAAGLLAHWLGKPLVVTARGCDINLIAQYALPRRWIVQTARRAAATIGVSQALTDRLAELGVPADKLHTLRNGVDFYRFKPEPRAASRSRLGLNASGQYLLMVGNLVELKGQRLAIEALSQIPGLILLLVGEGPEKTRLQDWAVRCGVAERVHFAGPVEQTGLKWWYSAADALALCSSREGWPNVLLESMACGTPVLSTAVSGASDIVTEPAAGVLLAQRDVPSLVRAWEQLKAAYPSRAATRAHAKRFSWDATTQGQLTLFRSIK